MLRSRPSEDSLATLCTSSTENDDVTSLFSLETLTAASYPIFNKPILSYTRIRELPLVVGQIKLDLQLFPSLGALKNGESPLFSIQLNKLHFFKKNSPLLTIFIHRDDSKSEFCKVYFKILRNNLTCYVLMFSKGEKVVLFNNALKPHSDSLFRNTKIRLVGASGASAFSNGSLRLLLLKPETPTLVDGLDYDSLDAAETIKDVDLSKNSLTPLFDSVVRQERTKVLNYLNNAKLVVEVPFASYTDHGDTKIEGVRVTGLVRLFESTIMGEEEKDIPEDSLIVVSMLITLVEQEIRKMRGSNKPLYVV